MRDDIEFVACFVDKCFCSIFWKVVTSWGSYKGWSERDSRLAVVAVVLVVIVALVVNVSVLKGRTLGGRPGKTNAV